MVGGDSEGDVRALSRVGRQNLRQTVFGVVDGDLDAQGAADGVLAHLQLLPQGVELPGGALDDLPCGLPGGGQGDALFAAQEKRCPQICLHVLEPLAQGGLGEVELFCGAGQVAGVGQRQEDQQVFFVHGMSPSFSWYFFQYTVLRTEAQGGRAAITYWRRGRWR